MGQCAVAGLSSEVMVEMTNERIYKVYELQSKIGQGRFGTVHKAKHRNTGAVQAVKLVEKNTPEDVKKVYDEISVLQEMDTPLIVKLLQTFEDDKNIYLVMEMCSGGNLLTRLCTVGKFSEVHTSILMDQILRAIDYMHEKGVCHRDIKPDNFVLMDHHTVDHHNQCLKAIDFGVATRCTRFGSLKGHAGTVHYIAPEVLTGKYGKPCDVWSAGVTMYYLLCGYLPFMGTKDAEVYEKAKAGKVDFEVKVGEGELRSRVWANISKDAQAFVRKLLDLNQWTRLSAKTAHSDRWLQDSMSTSSLRPTLARLLTSASSKLSTSSYQLEARTPSKESKGSKGSR